MNSGPDNIFYPPEWLFRVKLFFIELLSFNSYSGAISSP